MKKLVLSLVLAALGCGMAFGQEPQTTMPKPTPITSNQDTITPTNARAGDMDNTKNTQKLFSKNTIGNVGGTQVIFGITFGFRTKKDKDADSKASRILLDYEMGAVGKKVPLFGTIGLGWLNSDYQAKIPGYSRYYHTVGNTFRLSGRVGGIIGNWQGLHVSVRSGVVMNYLVNYKVNDEKQNLSGTDRVSWNGSVKFGVGYSIVNFMAEYEFPFVSGSKGIWMFGILLGF